MTRLNLLTSLAFCLGLSIGSPALSLQPLPGSQGTLYLESFQGQGEGLKGIQVAEAQSWLDAGQGSEAKILDFMDKVCAEPGLVLEFRFAPTQLNQDLVQRLLRSTQLCGLSHERVRFATLDPGQSPEDAEGLIQLSIIPRVDTRTTAAWEAYR